MLPAVAAAASIGVAVYFWLAVSTLPITRGLRATLRSRWGHGWRYALPLAIGVSVMTAAVALAVAIVTAMLSPSTGRLLGDPALVVIGSAAGLGAWCARSAALGPPRLSPHLELGLVLALVALTSDDAVVLSTVEREYARHVLRIGAPYVPRVARTVLGV
jgi:hypothetical protein